MPNNKSAEKRLRQADRARERNRAMKSLVGSQRSTLDEAVVGKDKEKGAAAFRDYTSAIDRAVKKGVMSKNTANRRKSRAHQLLASI